MKTNKTKINGVDVTFTVHQVGDEEFDIKRDHFKLLASKNNYYLYERSTDGNVVAFEYVTGVNKENKYPADEDFGKYGYCYSYGFIKNNPTYLKDRFKINWIYTSE